MTTLLHLSGGEVQGCEGQGSSYFHKEDRGGATLTSNPLLEGRWEGDHGPTHPLHSTPLKRREAKAMAPFPPSS